MIEGQAVEYAPQQNIVKETIEHLIGNYTEIKQGFFLNVTKEDSPGSEQLAAKSYTMLIRVLHSLLDLVKPDNIEIVEDIINVQLELEQMDNNTMIEAQDVHRLRELCCWVDTHPLRPHLKTQPNIASCRFNTHETF